jgi:hypothetical protein
MECGSFLEKLIVAELLERFPKVQYISVGVLRRTKYRNGS